MSELSALVKEFDIFVIVETWLNDDANIDVDGYNYLRCDRKKNKRAKRGPGGVCVYIKKNHLKGIQKISSKNDDCMWIKLSKILLQFRI